MKSGKLVLGVLAGLATGAILGILFAPDKGCKTRSKIIGGAKDLAEDFKQKIMDEVAALKSKAEELELLAEEKMNSLKDGIKEKVDAFKEA